MNHYPTYGDREEYEYEYDGHSSEEESEITDYLSQPRPVSQPPPEFYYSSYAPMESHSSSQFQRYQPGQTLAPIHTGETLEIPHGDIGSHNSHSSSQHMSDPFQGSSSHHDPYYQDQDYVPSAHSHTGSRSPDREFDHFAYDAEAEASYASGYSPSYYPARSRSPTPAVDDEDFIVVGDGSSVHYTNASDMMSEKDASDYAYPGFDQLSVLPADMGRHPSNRSESEPETPAGRLHFGSVPVGRTERRHLKKIVKLTKQGELSFEMQIPQMLVLPRQATAETRATQYSLITCDPDEFPKRNYPIRQLKYRRVTEIFVVITMFNVSDILTVPCLDITETTTGR